MKPEWQSQNIEKAFQYFFRVINLESDARGYEVSVTDLDPKILNLDSSFIWMQDDNVITFNLDVNGCVTGVHVEECGTTDPNPELMQTLLDEAQQIAKTSAKFSDIAPQMIQKIGLLFGVPLDLEIEFSVRLHSDDDYITEKLSELMLHVDMSLDITESIASFATRWELVVDLLESLQANHINVSIGPVETDHEQILETMQDQGINLLNEHECYVYVLGMCGMVENIWSLHKAGNVSIDEVATVVAALRATLAVIQPFVPEAYFTRFLQ